MVWKNSVLAGLILCAAFCRPVGSANAMECQWQPRVETGLNVCSIEIGTLSQSNSVLAGTGSGNTQTQEKIAFSDTMPVFGAGTTLFVHRFFLDIKLQCSISGDDTTDASFSIYEEDHGDGSSLFVSSDPTYRGTFDRKDAAVSLGYAVTEQLSLFVGYKWAQLDLDTNFKGPYSMLSIDHFAAVGQITGKEHLRFKYEGLFAGLGYGWYIKRASNDLGAVSVTLGLAGLNSKCSQTQTGNIRFDTINGIEVDPIRSTYRVSTEKTGETVGVTLGLNWNGATPIENLFYRVAASGYRYKFTLDHSDTDIQESSVILMAGLIYVF